MKGRLLAAVAALLLGMSGASAQGTGEGFRGKEIRLIVGTSTGGGYDSFARIVQPHLGRHLPGNPSVVVQNMPGGDGLSATNYMAKLAPRDGTMIAITNRNLAVAPLLGMVEASSVQYEAAQFTWLANLNTDVSFVIIRAETGVRSLEDLRSRAVIVGATGVTANNGIYPYVANNLLGTQFKVVTGYPGSSEMALALDRGEIDGVVGFSSASLTTERPDWVRDGKVLLLMQLGLKPLAGYEKIPLMLDLARSEDDRRALELIAAPNALGRPFFAPPQLPAATAAMLRAGFAAMVKDESFTSAAGRARLEISFIDGEALQATVQRLNQVSPEVVKVARAALQKNQTQVDERKRP